MLKILLAFLIMIEILILPLMIFCLSGVSIVLPGLGLIISGGLVFIILLVIEVILVSISLILYRRLRQDSNVMP